MSIEPQPRIYYSKRLKQKFISSLRPLDDVQPFTKQKEGDLINFRHTIVEGNIRRGRNGGVVVQKSSKLSTIILSKSTAKKKKIKHARCRSDGCDINLRISIPKNNMKTSPSYAKIFKPLNLFGINNNNKERYLSKKKSQKEKGGRVDLINHKCSQSTLSLSNTDRYSIRKSSPDSTFTFSRYRVPLVKKEQSAKIIQSWWRFLNIKLKPMRDMVIKIQSVWRGFYLRKYVFDVIFNARSEMVSSGVEVPYVLFLTAGLVPWFYFSEAITNGTNALLEYSYLVKKVVFNISILPLVEDRTNSVSSSIYSQHARGDLRE